MVTDFEWSGGVSAEEIDVYVIGRCQAADGEGIEQLFGGESTVTESVALGESRRGGTLPDEEKSGTDGCVPVNRRLSLVPKIRRFSSVRRGRDRR